MACDTRPCTFPKQARRVWVELSRIGPCTAILRTSSSQNNILRVGFPGELPVSWGHSTPLRYDPDRVEPANVQDSMFAPYAKRPQIVYMCVYVYV